MSTFKLKQTVEINFIDKGTYVNNEEISIKIKSNIIFKNVSGLISSGGTISFYKDSDDNDFIKYKNNLKDYICDFDILIENYEMGILKDIIVGDDNFKQLVYDTIWSIIIDSNL